ncbi:MAG: FAD:protein FMN transferase [Aristaeellaceae bacterium]
MRRALALLLILSLMLLGGCAAREEPLTRYTHSFFGTFDTFIVLTGYAASQEEFDRAAQVCEASFRYYDELFDPYVHSDTVENVFNLNQKAWKEPVKVSEDMMELLLQCRERAETLSPVVNPAMGRVLSIWHDARENAEYEPASAALPDMEELSAAAEHISLEDLILDPDAMTVYYADPLLRLDLGAVAKGYAAGKVAEQLADMLPVYSLNAGGNLVLGPSPENGWKVSVQHPDKALVGEEDAYLCTLQVENCAVVTSGDYQRYYVVDGQRLHHIIDPDTLMPAAHVRAVTIIAPDSGLADWLSTAVFVLPYEEGRALVDSLSDVEALWYLPDGTVHMTEGFADSIIQ